jgi:hypothetical protein
VFPRPTLTVRSPLAASSHGQALSPWYSSRRPGLEITRHQQGFTHVHPSGLPLARCSPGRNGGPSAFPGLRTPTDRTRRRTPERGSISNTDRELRTRHNGPPTCEVTRNTRPRVVWSHLSHVRSFCTPSSRSLNGVNAPPLRSRYALAPAPLRERAGGSRATRGLVLGVLPCPWPQITSTHSPLGRPQTTPRQHHVLPHPSRSTMAPPARGLIHRGAIRSGRPAAQADDTAR